MVLATGGAGQLFAATTNPEVATGDGLAMALRAGRRAGRRRVHAVPPDRAVDRSRRRGQRPLVTEAVRGEGAVLIDAAGARIMTGVHPLADLAPRDVVSLAITRRLATAPGGVADHVFLDATGIARGDVRPPVPDGVSGVRAGRDRPRPPTPIPVAPGRALPLRRGGDRPYGRTTVPGLYAVGEVARTGLHGANRLASNSLLEGLVMGERVADAVEADLVGTYLSRGYHRWRRLREVAALPSESASGPESASAARPDVRGVVQAAMSRWAGIGRSAAGLSEALDVIAALGDAATVQDANLVLVAKALLTAAIARDESRGCHVRTDAPALDPAQARSTVLTLRDGEFVASSLRPDWESGWSDVPLAVAG